MNFRRTINTIRERYSSTTVREKVSAVCPCRATCGPFQSRSMILASLWLALMVCIALLIPKIHKPSDNQLCPSLYQTGVGFVEHSPVVFERDDIMVCRTPQVGSKFIRDLTMSYVTSNLTSYFSEEDEKKGSKGFQHLNPTLDKIHESDKFNYYLYDMDISQRIMFVRHPITRIVAGFYDIASSQSSKFWMDLYGYNEDHGYSGKSFLFWLQNSSFVEDYQSMDGSICSDHALYESLHPQYQQWSPPQVCRCGIMDCGVQWTIHKVEDSPTVMLDVMTEALGRRVKDLYVQTELQQDNTFHNDVANILNDPRYDMSEYLTANTLAILNPLTLKEQIYLGYQPL